MPEGHTIHRHARDQRKLLQGKVVAVSSPQGRFERADTLDGRRLLDVEAWGKHLVYVFEGPEPRRVHVHLGLFGKFRRHKTPAPPPRTTCRMRLLSETHALDLTGPTACELMNEAALAMLLARLGPDPLRDDADRAAALARLKRTRSSIGAALLDQSVLAGVGNVYRAEALHACGIHPDVRAMSLPMAVLERLWDTVVAMLQRGVREGRIVTAVDFAKGEKRRRVPRREALVVYARRTCRRCGSPVRRWLVRQRWAYACETCQPLPSAAPEASRPIRIMSR